MLKLLPIVLIFFFGVVLGMQKANDGMRDMQGYSSTTLHEPVKWEVEEDEVSATFMGNQVGTYDITEKKEKLAEMEAFNAFSSMGQKLANMVEAATKSTIDFIGSFF